MSNQLTRGHQTGLRQGCIAARILPMIVENPSRAYANALCQDLNRQKPASATATDVIAALKLLADAGMLTMDNHPTPPTPGVRIYYQPTWLAAFHLELAAMASADAKIRQAAE